MRPPQPASDCRPGSVVYKLLAEHRNNQKLTFRKVNADEDIFIVDKLTGMVTVDEDLTPNTEFKMTVLVEDHDLKHVNLANIFIQVNPAENGTKPNDVEVAASTEEIPKVLVAGRPWPGHLSTLVYGNTLHPVRLNTSTGEVILRHIPCTGRHDIYIGLYNSHNAPQMILWRLRLNLAGASHLPLCSGKKPPASWVKVEGPKLIQITVGPHVSLLA